MTAEHTVTPLRSVLFCPATEPRRVAKLRDIGADAAALDLEDAVSENRKTAARSEARAGVAHLGTAVRSYVRVNSMSTGRTEEDIKAVVQPCLDGIVLPKVDDAESVRLADAWLLEAEKSEGVEAGSTAMLVLIETGLGVENATQILSSSPRVETAIFGFVDFMLDVGIDVIDHTPTADELLYARSRLVVAARAAGVSPPLDGPFIDIHAHDAFEAQCRQARRLGFRGKMLIHPSQVARCHIGFAPTGEEVVAARRIVEEFSRAEAAGVAAVVVDGRLVDYPIYLRAQRIITAGDPGPE